MVVSVGPGPEAIEPLATERLEPVVEATPALRQAPVSGVSKVDKVKRALILASKEKSATTTKKTSPS